MATMVHPSEIKILLLGMSGSGKSSVGNLLLGRKVFKVGRLGITRTSQLERGKLEDGNELVIVDTPGYCNIHLTEEETQTEINRGMELLAPGPHIIMYVQSVRQPLTQSDDKVIHTLTEKFQFYSNTFVMLFSGIDDLDENIKTLDEFIQKNKQISMLLKQQTPVQVCSKRFDDTSQFDLLVQAIKNHYETNGSLYPDLERETIDKPNIDETPMDLTVPEIREKGAAAEPTTNDTRHIILLGKSGNGKSSLGNNLLGAQKFSTSLIEDRRTQKCQIELTDHMVVVDTPGFFSTSRSDLDVAKEIINTLKLNKMEIHVYVLVLSVDERLSGDEKESIELIKRLFGKHVFNNMIVVFTGKDSLEDDGLAEFQFPRCLPQMPYFILDCKHGKLEEVEKIHNDIFSEKYKNTHVLDADRIDWATIEKEEKGRKDSLKLDVDGFVDAVQSRVELTQRGGKSLQNHKKSSSQEMVEEGASVDPTTNDTKHILLLGKSGNGKSSLGNNLLGAQKFSTSLIEDRRTKVCQIEVTDHVVVVDTPGFFSTSRSDVDVAKEIINTLKLNKMEIHVYVLVLSVDERLSGDEKESIELIKRLFGEHVFNNMIVVFTGKDSLEDDELAEFQFPRCLPQMPYVIFDCKHSKREEIHNEIFKYKYGPHIFDVDCIDWDIIEKEERRRKDSQKIDVDGYTDAVQSSLTQREGNSRFQPLKTFVTGLFSKIW